MKNLLDNVNVGIIFLDSQMHIRRFTREATRTYRLAQSDVGRHLGDIKTNLLSDDLLTHAQNVLDSLIPYEVEIRDTNAAWCLVHIQPYRSLDNVIDGVVVTFTDITSRVESIAMHEALELAEGIVNTVREPLLVLDSALNVVSVSRSFYRIFKVPSDEVIKRPIFELGNGQWNIPELRKLLANVVTNDDVFDDYVVEHDFPIIGHQKMLLNARRINSRSGHVQLILLAMEDVND
jgi:two-component system, chemotaxis family, CheB/CheR fusion protein